MEEFHSNLIISGSGGQGIQFIGKFIAQYFMNLNYNVTYIPSYGAEMRGGPTDAQVKISSNYISMPVVENATYTMFLSKLLIDKFAFAIKDSTKIIYNSDIINQDNLNIYKDSKLIELPANTISKEFGMAGVVNIPFIYKYLSSKNKFNMDNIKKTLNIILANKPQKLIENNIKYFNYLQKNNI